MKVDYKDVEQDFERYELNIKALERQISGFINKAEKRGDLLEECLEILRENNWRGDLQEEIKEVLSL